MADLQKKFNTVVADLSDQQLDILMAEAKKMLLEAQKTDIR